MAASLRDVLDRKVRKEPAQVLITDLRKEFATSDGVVAALGPISLEIGASEWVSLVGPSGCGKSTLLNIIAGLTLPTEGSVRLESPEPDEGPPRIGLMFQDPRLLPWRSALRNVSLGIEDGMHPTQWEAVSRDLLRQVGLSDFANALPYQLSGGMRQRVALARTLAVEPDLMLLDEPLAAVDYVARVRLQRDLESLWHANRWTVLYVTHDPLEALLLGDRVALMSPRPGRIIREIGVDLPRPRRREDPHLMAMLADLIAAMDDSSQGTLP
jgi:ABC-type nitrate/sulfonate/bicarbonate transport system ATPase subunit